MAIPSVVADIMTKNPVTLSIPGSREDLIDAIHEHKYSYFPIVKNKKAIGIAGRTELFEKPQETQLALLITRLNQGISSVSPDTPIKKIANYLLKNWRDCLLVTEGDTLIGFITISDIVWKVIANSNIEITIENYYSRKFASVWAETPLNVVEVILQNSGQNAIPVLNNSGKIMGIIGWHDLFQVIEERSSEQLSSTTSSAEYDPGSWDSETVLVIGSKTLVLPNKPASSFMSKKELITAYENSSLIDCTKKMMKYQISQIPVVNAEGTLKGLLTHRNLLHIYLELG